MTVSPLRRLHGGLPVRVHVRFGHFERTRLGCTARRSQRSYAIAAAYREGGGHCVVMQSPADAGSRSLRVQCVRTARKRGTDRVQHVAEIALSAFPITPREVGLQSRGRGI